MRRYLLLLICLSGCASTTADLMYMAEIEEAYDSFVSDCNFLQGKLYVARRRVQNAPPTVWEMKDAVCWFDDDMDYILIKEIKK